MKYKVSPEGHPILDQFSEEGFVDCVFQITNRISGADHHELRLRASFQGDVVGMSVVVRKDMRGAFDADTNLIAAHVYRQGLEFLRGGPESDNLVAALAQLYRLPVGQTRMIDRIGFTGIALHGDGEVDMEVDPIKIKLFAHDTDADWYSESFFNLDLKNGFVFWNEKDQDYRAPLVRALSVERR